MNLLSGFLIADCIQTQSGIVIDIVIVCRE